MPSSEARGWLSLWKEPGSAAAASVSDREKAMAAPKDWGMFMEEPGWAVSLDKPDLEQSDRWMDAEIRDGGEH